MNNEKKKTESHKVNRRTLVRRGLKAAYVVPAILAAVKATERPAYGQTSGSPLFGTGGNGGSPMSGSGGLLGN